MGLKAYLVNGLNNASGTLMGLIVVSGACLQVLERLSLAVMRSDQGCKHKPVPEIRSEVCDYLRVHRIDSAVVVGHPLQQNGFWNTVDITLGHVWLDAGLGG